MAFTKKQYEIIASKIKLFSPAFERGISEGEFEKRLKEIEQQVTEKRLNQLKKYKYRINEYLKGDYCVGYNPPTILQKAFINLFIDSMGLRDQAMALSFKGHTISRKDTNFCVIFEYYPNQKIYVAKIESENFCPYLEAFKYMRLKPKMCNYLCKNVLEKPCQTIVDKVNPNVKFTREYDKIRPQTRRCYEYLILTNYTPSEKEFERMDVTNFSRIVENEFFTLPRGINS